MSSNSNSRFTSANHTNQTTNERLSTNTVGLVELSDYRKRRAEVLEQQEREAREAILGTVASGPERSRATTTLANASENENDAEEKQQTRKKKKRRVRALVSFGDDEEGDEEEAGPVLAKDSKEGSATDGGRRRGSADEGVASSGNKTPGKMAANSAVGIVPRALTKAALRREAAERDALRKEFLVLQAAIKATEMVIPFVFYDGTNIPGGAVRVKKGDFVWVFLDKSRKVGAELQNGGDKSAQVRREWARVSVDDLLLVRGSIIIPHHYEFYFFIVNKTVGPGNQRLFDYSAEVPQAPVAPPEEAGCTITTPSKNKALADIRTLEGFSDDAGFTKVVDRRWYERNKHIYPASVWQEFDPEKNYQDEIRRDPGGNAFFFSK